MTRLGIERERFLIVTSMMRSGIPFAEALMYADLIWPIDHLIRKLDKD